MADRVEIFYPGFVKKALTFSIDDGNIKYDRMMLDIVRPAGILGTFNLCAPKPELTREEYIEMYSGYEISNHTLLHTYAFLDDTEYNFKDEIYIPGACDPSYIYRHKDDPSLYYICRGNDRWRLITDADTYIKGIDECKARLEEIFGEGSIRGFVWPFFEQNNKKIKDHIVSGGYYGIRKSGPVGSSTGFALPDDFSAWGCNARHTNLLALMDEYMLCPDDGELKFFSFGVHSADFERDSKWDDLREFACRYGGRHDILWYATVGEIFDYVSAVKTLLISDDCVKNPSDVAIYLRLDGKDTVIDPKREILL